MSLCTKNEPRDLRLLEYEGPRAGATPPPENATRYGPFRANDPRAREAPQRPFDDKKRMAPYQLRPQTAIAIC